MISAQRCGFLAQILVQRWLPLSLEKTSSLHTGFIMEAARKGTRAKADAKKKSTKKVEVKREFIPLKQRLELQQTGGASPRRVENHLKDPIDNVWFTLYYKWKVYSVKDAIAMHRETHHETQIGRQDSYIKAVIELDMSLDKKNRYIDSLSNVAQLPHDFDTEQHRTVLAISRHEEVIEQAWQMGVTLASGLDIIKQVQNGEVNLHDYQHIIAETDTLPELVAVRGLIRKRFPNLKNGTAGNNIIPIIERFIKGVEYETAKDKYHHDYATIEAQFGKLNMSDEQLEENLASLLNDVESQRPHRKSNQLITQVVLRSPPSFEQFKIDHLAYIKDKTPSMAVAAAV
ncbi:uncharacterized protein mRpL1 [Panulirus ornatus]|uniref:uncharacterized protein mRpL1 n=1 Tax=Panulirus ornatus TaxID=150431 RepID=UPI003A89E28A